MAADGSGDPVDNGTNDLREGHAVCNEVADRVYFASMVLQIEGHPGTR